MAPLSLQCQKIHGNNDVSREPAPCLDMTGDPPMVALPSLRHLGVKKELLGKQGGSGEFFRASFRSGIQT